MHPLSKIDGCSCTRSNQVPVYVWCSRSLPFIIVTIVHAQIVLLDEIVHQSYYLMEKDLKIYEWDLARPEVYLLAREQGPN